MMSTRLDEDRLVLSFCSEVNFSLFMPSRHDRRSLHISGLNFKAILNLIQQQLVGQMPYHALPWIRHWVLYKPGHVCHTVMLPYQKGGVWLARIYQTPLLVK